ncbi:hypothetical protein SeMB42_g01969 [Synchytrium endobioticum]|uniref:Molybdenum cofactor sulfurase n=1 Tax=Synchytrium endobioticum TaxID=286115 RepID=A0A507DHW0_9FUNG|nr:hypothetical protein SeLEV6574_g00454 [Synchytrium endobioticum]TPX51321.1 hypothetical protein SeMB42_g01969 [Synchytrium endobioticum]
MAANMEEIISYIQHIRNHDFPQLSSSSPGVYLDHAGCTLAPKKLLESYMRDITTNLYGNPHTFSSPSATLSSRRVSQVRNKILRHFNAPPQEYSIVFTANTTAALKLVAECLEWGRNADYHYLSTSHTSVVGIREYIRYARRYLPPEQISGRIKCMTPNQVEHWLSPSIPNGHDITPSNHSSGSTDADGGKECNLFTFPAQCNFSGTRYPLEWVHKIKALKTNNGLPWKVLVDIAAYSTTTPMDFTLYPADLAVLSFYKMFGFPTNLGALIVRNDMVPCMTKRYFGGGSVTAITSIQPWQMYRETMHERFEDGTIPFLEIIAVDHGFEYVENMIPSSLGYKPWQLIREWTLHLMNYAKNEMKTLEHNVNGKLTPVCQIYEANPLPCVYSQNGPVIAFNILKPNGQYVGCSEVAKLSAIHDIHIRTGCFCNPGACQLYLELSDQEIQDHAEIHGHVCGDDMDIVNGSPTGAIRISFGWMNTLDDANAWLRFLTKYYQTIITSPAPNDQIICIDGHENSISSAIASQINEYTVESLSVFPIKSCGAYTSFTEWPIGPEGLLYDRNWMLVDENGTALSQKRYPKMCLIRPVTMNLTEEMMVLEAPGMTNLRIYMGSISDYNVDSFRARVCGDRIQTFLDSRPHVSHWFSTFLDTSCQLARCNMNFEGRLDKHSHKQPTSNTIDSPRIAFANESQFLLVSLASFKSIKSSIYHKETGREVDVSCMRANIVIDGNHLGAFEEDSWTGKTLEIDGQVFQVQGPCNRCSMICINQRTGEKSREPFSTLALKRKVEGRINFGLHLAHVKARSKKPFAIRIGSTLRIL